MSGRELRVGLAWHSLSSGNLGVVALTVANMMIIRQAAEAVGRAVSIVTIGFEDGDRPPVTGSDDKLVDRVVVTGRSLLSPTGVWREVGNLDVLVDIGAGDSWTDIYGAKRFAFLYLTKEIAVARGIPLILAPQTIGPFHRRWMALPAGRVMKRAEAVVARDPASAERLRELAPGATAITATDVAFALPWTDRSAERGGERIRVGLNLSGLLWSDAESGRNRFGLSYDYARAMRLLAERLAVRPDVELLLVPHVVSGLPDDDDAGAVRRLAKAVPNARVLGPFATPSDAKSALSSMDLVIAARMHAAIAALGAGVPVVPMAYSPKFAGLFNSLGYPHVLPATGWTTDQVVDKLDEALTDRARLAAALPTARARADALLEPYRALLRRTFAALP